MIKRHKELSCLILAGGESKRFGENKALFSFAGFTFIERALNVALDVSPDIVISIREEAQINEYSTAVDKIIKKRCEKNKKEKFNIKLISDDINCGLKGPVKGIFSSIKSLSGEFILVMECDAPFFNTEAARALISKAKTENVGAVVPLWPNSVVEPLLACYKRNDIIHILNLLNNYSLSLKDDFLFNDAINILRLLPSVYYYSVMDIAENSPNLPPYIFININNKQDLDKMAKDKKVFPAYNKSLMKDNAKSVKIRKVNKFFDVKNPKNVPYGIMAKALYYWWVYAVTKNYIYFEKSICFFKKDSAVYLKHGLNFMGNKLIKILPGLNNIITL
ncbi:MAG: molybdenum cofactor guanylyltransferase [Deltaproteobacteria bacterium]|jgi:molybdopterin-guanine dinucleotide biosynthesis protein A|nr:molybdenum cofactor guanylyltransferase [Deltaproteobacteria bacterium]MCL5880009.1 molybdenum cofactor guanylyltransferase [Deltaproteobacteria bacterium]MDA8304716.1 molybdenum cofactor guanylyltransferase [Deltaproteobacteria bacterium]